MKSTLFHIVGLLWLSTLSLTADQGGMTATFTPDEAQPGDLITLWVQMNREDYGEFDLDIPSHPRLHLVTREQIPPTLVNGHFYQGERLTLQALSSGPLTLSGMTVQLTEAEGVRTVALPELTLTVAPFDAQDTIEDPQPLPRPESARGNSPPLTPTLIAVLIGGFLLVLLIRIKLAMRENPDDHPTSNPGEVVRLTNQAITEGDFEYLLNEHRDTLSPKLCADLENWIYAPDRSDTELADLQSRVREELSA